MRRSRAVDVRIQLRLATLEPSPPEIQEPFGAIVANQAAMNAFVRMNAGMISPAEFFASGNVGMAAAQVRTR